MRPIIFGLQQIFALGSFKKFLNFFFNLSSSVDLTLLPKHEADSAKKSDLWYCTKLIPRRDIFFLPEGQPV